AYLEAKQDAKVIALTGALLDGPALANASPIARANVLVLAGKARFNQYDLEKARSRFEAAQQLRPADIAIRRALVQVISEQAAEDKDPKTARSLIDQALAIDPASPVALVNAAVLSIGRGDCEGARVHLGKLEGVRGHDEPVRLRLYARALSCGTKTEPKRALDTYAAADKAARKAGTILVAAEI